MQLKYKESDFVMHILVIFEKCAKLHSPRRLVQFWHIFQISLVALIINCTPSRVITVPIQINLKPKYPPF